MIEDNMVADISDEVLEFVKPNIFEKKMLVNKRPVKNRLLRSILRKKSRFLGNALLVDKGCNNGYT
jgi:hypothetical protein